MTDEGLFTGRPAWPIPSSVALRTPAFPRGSLEVEPWPRLENLPASAWRLRSRWCLPQVPQQRLAKRKARKQEQTKSNFAPRLPTPRSVRLLGILTSNVRRRDDGAIDLRRADSPDPRICQTLRLRRRVWHQAPFLLDRARPVFFSARRKENGGCIPAGPPQAPPAPGEPIPPPCFNETQKENQPPCRTRSLSKAPAPTI